MEVKFFIVEGILKLDLAMPLKDYTFGTKSMKREFGTKPYMTRCTSKDSSLEQ